jgi:hypothetical protein
LLAAECDCISGFVPHQNLTTNGFDCYQEYLQGPCPDNQQFVSAIHAPPGASRANADESPFGTVCVAFPQCGAGLILSPKGKCVEEPACSSSEVVLFEANGTSCGDIGIRSLTELLEVCAEGESPDSNGHCQSDIAVDESQKRPARAATSNADLKKFLKERFAGKK